MLRRTTPANSLIRKNVQQNTPPGGEGVRQGRAPGREAVPAIEIVTTLDGVAEPGYLA